MAALTVSALRPGRGVPNRRGSRCPCMSGVDGTEDGAGFAQLTGAYWLDDGGEHGGRSHARAGARRDQPLEHAGASVGMAGRLTRSRRVMLPVAVLTVAAALLVRVLV